MLARLGATHLQAAAAGVILEIHSLKRIFRRIGLGQGILGMKSGKRTILQEMLNLPYLRMPVRYPFSIFLLIRTPSKLNNHCKNMRFDFFLKPIIP